MVVERKRCMKGKGWMIGRVGERKRGNERKRMDDRKRVD